jgi:hypothetical protein
MENGQLLKGLLQPEIPPTPEEDLWILEGEEFSKKMENLARFAKEEKNLKKCGEIFNLLKKGVEEILDGKGEEGRVKRVKENGVELLYSEVRGGNLFVLDFWESGEEGEIGEIDIEKIENLAFKLYPMEIVFNGDFLFWLHHVAKNREGNISLSQEERDILDEVLGRGSHWRERFPIYINGRAGSGKSTILQYIFAHYLTTYLAKRGEGGEREGDPKLLYLTYTPQLKERAIDQVANIIIAKRYLRERLAPQGLEEEGLKGMITPFFQSFIEEIPGERDSFLLSHLPDKVLAGRRRASLGEIYTIIEEILKYNPVDISPEMVYYIIRTFIKGMATVEEGEVSFLREFEKIPRRLRENLLEEDFKVVVEKIFPIYQRRLEEKGLFDDLDPVLEGLKWELYWDLDNHYGIFCDEAQDFTHIELKLILNLNRYLSRENYSRLPVVFAGDPFQSINPTGFSISHLKSLIYTAYQEKIGGKGEINTDVKELRYNYRSNGGITRLGNTLLLKKLALQQRNITPSLFQKNWSIRRRGLKGVHFLNWGSLEVQGALKNQKGEYDYLIVPENFEKVEKEDPVVAELKGEVEGEEGGEVRLLTPIDVKGLEKPVVVVYRFGDFFHRRFEAGEGEKEKKRAKVSENSRKIQLEHFLSNLYVAVTRGMERVLVVESERGHKFWVQLNKLVEERGFSPGDREELFQNIPEEMERDLREAGFGKLSREELLQRIVGKIEDLFENTKFSQSAKERVGRDIEWIVDNYFYSHQLPGVYRNWVELIRLFLKVGGRFGELDLGELERGVKEFLKIAEAPIEERKEYLHLIGRVGDKLFEPFFKNFLLFNDVYPELSKRFIQIVKREGEKFGRADLKIYLDLVDLFSTGNYKAIKKLAAEKPYSFIGYGWLERGGLEILVEALFRSIQGQGSQKESPDSIGKDFCWEEGDRKIREQILLGVVKKLKGEGKYRDAVGIFKGCPKLREEQPRIYCEVKIKTGSEREVENRKCFIVLEKVGKIWEGVEREGEKWFEGLEDGERIKASYLLVKELERLSKEEVTQQIEKRRGKGGKGEISFAPNFGRLKKVPLSFLIGAFKDSKYRGRWDINFVDYLLYRVEREAKTNFQREKFLWEVLEGVGVQVVEPPVGEEIRKRYLPRVAKIFAPMSSLIRKRKGASEGEREKKRKELFEKVVLALRFFDPKVNTNEKFWYWDGIVAEKLLSEEELEKFYLKIVERAPGIPFYLWRYLHWSGWNYLKPALPKRTQENLPSTLLFQGLGLPMSGRVLKRLKENYRRGVRDLEGNFEDLRSFMERERGEGERGKGKGSPASETSTPSSHSPQLKAGEIAKGEENGKRERGEERGQGVDWRGKVGRVMERGELDKVRGLLQTLKREKKRIRTEKKELEEKIEELEELIEELTELKEELLKRK